MAKPTSKNVLWENVLALMHHRWGKENITGFAKWAEIGVGSAQRIRDQETSVGLDIVDKIAKKAGLDPWQLLVPGLEVTNPPLLAEDAKRVHELIANIQSSNEAISGLLRKSGNTKSGDLG